MKPLVNSQFPTNANLQKLKIIMAGIQCFKVAGYPIEERGRWPAITASPRGQCSK